MKRRGLVRGRAGAGNGVGTGMERVITVAYHPSSLVFNVFEALCHPPGRLSLAHV